jgi:hypothetical protein
VIVAIVVLVQLLVDVRVDTDGDLVGHLDALGQRLSGVFLHLDVEELAVTRTMVDDKASGSQTDVQSTNDCDASNYA